MTLKVLGQAAPAATTDTDLYNVPANNETVVSTLAVANRAATDATFRVAVRPAGAVLANQHYIAYDAPITANDSTFMTIGISLAAGDIVTVRGSTANLSFSLFGQEGAVI